MSEEGTIKKATETELKLVFADVLNGYTRIDGKKLNREEDFYIKHISILDNIRTDEDYETALQKAKKNNLPSEEEQLEYLNRDKIWTSKDQAEIDELKKLVSKTK